MANLATKRGVEGHRLQIHTPLIDITKGETIRRGLELGVDYALTRSCYDPSPSGRGLRRLRLVPASTPRASRRTAWRIPPRISPRRRRLADAGSQRHRRRASGSARPSTFPVVEIFGPTVQGEGPDAGVPAYFVRFGGCDFRCSWCDSMHAVDPAEVRANAERLTAPSDRRAVLRAWRRGPELVVLSAAATRRCSSSVI